MKYLFLKTILALVVCVGMRVATPAQTTQETPEAVAKAYMEASRAADWVRCASLMHPDALKQLRGLFEPLVAATKTEKDKKEMESILGVKDKADFDKLTDADIFAKLFGVLTLISPELRKILNSSSFDIVGQLQESPDLVHIVYRMHLKIEAPGIKVPISMTKLEVMSLRRFENTWRADLKGDIQGMIQAMAAGMAAAAQEEKQEAPAPKTQEAPAPKKQAAPGAKKKPVRKP